MGGPDHPSPPDPSDQMPQPPSPSLRDVHNRQHQAQAVDLDPNTLALSPPRPFPESPADPTRPLLRHPTLTEAVLDPSLPAAVNSTLVIAHLTVAGIVGTLIRIGLGYLFASTHGAIVMADWSSLYHDLPANTFGSFLAGVTLVWKAEIRHFSAPLKVAITGFLGAITTWSSWSQDAVKLWVDGQWSAALWCLNIGIQMNIMSLIIGVSCGHGVRWTLKRWEQTHPPSSKAQHDHRRRRLEHLACVTPLAIILFLASVLGAALDRSSLSRRQMWLACVFAPAGTALRIALCHLNSWPDRSHTWLRWYPRGTFLANLLACAVRAAVDVVKLRAVDYSSQLWGSAISVGFLGCLSTWSTVSGEVYNMYAKKERRAWVYLMSMLAICQLAGLLIYGVPLWVGGYSRPVLIHT